MSFTNKMLLLFTALIIAIALVSCSDTGDSITQDDTPPITEGPGNATEEKPGDENTDDKGSEDKNDAPALKDGLSEDGTYYRLTDKNGVVIRIPIGVPLNIASNGGITVDNGGEKKVRSGGQVAASEEDSSGQRSVCIFSTLSTYSIGYGAIKHPCEDGYINDPSGMPYTVDDQHALVIQCFDENYNEVSKDSPDVYYISIYVLDYLTDPGQLMFSKTIDYSYADGITLDYFTFSNIVFGTPYTQKSVNTTYDENIGEYVTVYRITESVALRTPTGVLVIELKWWYCNPDWTTITRHEHVFDDYFNSIGFIIYDHLDRMIYRNSVDENGNLVEYSYEFYPDGSPKVVDEPSLYIKYDESGNIIDHRKKTVISSDCYIWEHTGINEFGDRYHSIYEHSNGTRKETHYYPNTEVIRWIWVYNGDDKKISEESYTESGDLCLRTEYEYENGVLVKDSSRNYEDGELIMYSYCLYYADGSPKEGVTYYASGVKADEMLWTADGSSMTWNIYSETGELTQSQIYTYKEGVTSRLDTYFYETKGDSPLVVHTVEEYDELGQLKKYAEYENDALMFETYYTDSGITTYDYANGYVYYYDSDFNLIDKQPIG